MSQIGQPGPDRWDVFDTRAGGVRRGMDPEAVREALAEGRLTGADFARPSRGGRYRRIRDIPELSAPQREPGSPRRQRSVGEADLTPMVDVVFLLLLFFMLTASYEVQKAIPSPRPEQAEQGVQQTLQTMDQLREDHVLIRVEQNNDILVDGVPTSSDRLSEAIRRASRRLGHAEVLLDVHPDALHGTTVDVIDAAARAGAEHIRKTNPVDPLDQPER